MFARVFSNENTFAHNSLFFFKNENNIIFSVREYVSSETYERTTYSLKLGLIQIA